MKQQAQVTHPEDANSEHVVPISSQFAMTSSRTTRAAIPLLCRAVLLARRASLYLGALDHILQSATVVSDEAFQMGFRDTP